MHTIKLTVQAVRLFLLLSFVSLKAFPSERPIVQITPGWCLLNETTASQDLYYNYSSFVQEHVIDILSSMNVKAVPALYTSAFQTVYSPRSMEELDALLGYESKEQNRYLTLIPVIKNSEIQGNSRKYRITVLLSIYLQDKDGHLGKEFFTAELKSSGRTNSLRNNEDYLDILANSIKDQLSTVSEWQSVKDYTNNNSHYYDNFPATGKLSSFKEQTSSSFAQSDVMYFNDHPENRYLISSRLHKCNEYIIKANEDSDKLLFDFDLSNEIPDIIYAYIISPDFKVTPINNSDVHVEKSPYALPNDTYNSFRYLVVNLPGLTDGSIVCYAIKYSDPAYYDTTYFNSLKNSSSCSHLAKDFPVNYSNDTTSWQIRIWSPSGNNDKNLMAESNLLKITDSQSFCFSRVRQFPFRISGAYSSNNPYVNQFVNQLKADTSSLKEISEHADSSLTAYYRFRMKIFSGKPNPLPFPVPEPLSHMEQPVVRVSSVKLWNTLYLKTSDSIFSILDKKRNLHILKSIDSRSSNIDSSVFSLLNFMSDSLRYIHMSFNTHKTIPSYPDSVLKNRTGDCKDYSTLFISELRTLGIEAYPALVNIAWSRSQEMTLPSYDAFNHMIVYVPKFNWWIDPLYNPLPPGIVPQYLTGIKALVLFRDSMKVFDIRDNNDSTYSSSTIYNIKINGSDITCDYVEHPSNEKSYRLKKSLRAVDSTRYLDELFPSDRFFKRFSAEEIALSLSGIDNSNKDVIISRQFKVRNALTNANGIKLLNLPEMPLFDLVSVVSSSKRLSDLYFPYSIKYDLVIKLPDDCKASWPVISRNEKIKNILQVTKQSKNEIVLTFKLKKGLIPFRDYETFKVAIDSFRSFFSNPIPLQFGKYSQLKIR